MNSYTKEVFGMAVVESADYNEEGSPQECTVAAVLCVADALYDIAAALRALGTGDAATTMGAIEAHAVMSKDSVSGVASALSEVAASIRDSRN